MKPAIPPNMDAIATTAGLRPSPGACADDTEASMSTQARRNKHSIIQKLSTESAELPRFFNSRMREEAHFVLPCLMRIAATCQAAHELRFETPTTAVQNCQLHGPP